MIKRCTVVLLASCLLLCSSGVVAQSSIASKFDTLTMRFKGTKQAQARYLLRFVKKYANLGDTLTTLPAFIDSILTGKIPMIQKSALQKYLNSQNITTPEIGGALDTPISTASGVKAGYFVIHDTSNFLTGETFPANIDSASWTGNRLDNKPGFKYTHLFINRLGASITANDLGRSIHGTKFESPVKNPLIGKDIVGDFIHVEVIQPRVADPGKKNDAIAIMPGFSAPQYQRLALIYIVASLRSGDWLVPTFHAVIDDGIPDGHDDPQNFEIDRFNTDLSALVHLLQTL